MVVWHRIDDVPVEAERARLFGIARGVLANSWRSESHRDKLVTKLRALRSPSVVEIDLDAVTSEEGALIRRPLSHLRPGDQEILRLAA